MKLEILKENARQAEAEYKDDETGFNASMFYPHTVLALIERIEKLSEALSEISRNRLENYPEDRMSESYWSERCSLYVTEAREALSKYGKDVEI